MKRKIIKINLKKCDGCGLCIPNCPEGAIQIIDGKARLISDLFCDGLGACIKHCPKDAITIEEREAEPYDETKVMENIIKQGNNTIKAHLQHLKDHNETEYFNQAIDFLKKKGINIEIEKKQSFCGCPGSATRVFSKTTSNPNKVVQNSALRQWPIQFDLLSPYTPFFKDSDLLVAADCVPFADANFHNKLLEGKSLIISCPKLNEIEKEKFTEIFKNNNIKSITVAIMEVPCCYGLYSIVEDALKESKKDIPLEKKIISINGE